eukprot:Em0004g717a
MRETALAKHYIEEAGDFADVAYFVLISLWEYLDDLANDNTSKDRAGMKKALQLLLRNTSALEQKWLIRIILKGLKTGLSENSVFSVFHPDAVDLFSVCSNLEKVALTSVTPLSTSMSPSSPTSLPSDLCSESVATMDQRVPILNLPTSAIHTLLTNGRIIDGETIAPILTDKAVTFTTCSITFTRCATSPATSICTSARKGRGSCVVTNSDYVTNSNQLWTSAKCAVLRSQMIDLDGYTRLVGKG